MRESGLAVMGVIAVLLSGCISPEEQRAMDQQKCSGFGFRPGTESFANCMMGVTQQREAQEAADRRQQQQNAAIAAAQEQRDRDAKAARDAANRASSSGPASSGIDFPKIDMPTVPDNMTCTRTGSTSGNAGNFTENCHN